MEIVILNASEFEHLKIQISNMEVLLRQIVKKPAVMPVKSRMEETIDDIDNWVLLKYALAKMKISKTTWYARGYNKKLKTSKRGKFVKVFLPSILAYIEDGAIN